ncbi:MAG: hypothetical protein RLZ98_1990 [Pseudomonadota bacterium]
MRACVDASSDELQNAVGLYPHLSCVEDVRPPETGLVMLRGRIGGDGTSFNVGEATVTRAVVKLADGALGFSYLIGRSKECARLAAIIDALGQNPEARLRLEREFVAVVGARKARERDARRRKTAATRVDFFTLVRGEDDGQ